MQDRLSGVLETMQRRYSVPVFERLSTYTRSLAPGDKFIAGLLGLFVIVSSLLGLYALQRSVMVEVPAYGGTLTEGIVGSPRFANPLLALSDADRDLAVLTYAGLMGQGPDGSLVPVLAESYEVSEDGTSYTFVIRENAEFSDGKPVTAEDVAYTIQKAQDPSLKSPEFANWANIAVDVIDARTVRFRLPEAYAPFLEDTTIGILPAHLWRNIRDEEFPFSTLMTEPVGAGPFKVKSIQRDRNGLITGYDLVVNKKYAPGRAHLDSIKLRFFDDQAEVAAALRGGSIDSAYGVATANAIRAPYARVFGVFFNSADNPALAEQSVRHALSIAIDRTRLVNDALGGYATPIMGPVPPGSGIDVVPVETYEDRFAEARAILEEGGWVYDEALSMWTKDGASLEMTIKTSNVPELKAAAAEVQKDWAQLGVSTAIEIYEPGTLSQEVIRPRAYSALLFGMVVGRDRDLFAFWNSSERNDPGLNIAAYVNGEVDALLEKVRAETDRSLILSDLVELDRMIATDYPAAFTHSPDFLYTVPAGLRGVELRQVTAPSDRFATVANWYRYTQAVWPFLAP